MRMHGLRKIIKTIALLAALTGAFLVLTAGVLSDEVEFKNVTRPFIDLDAGIADLDTGHGGIAETGIEDDGVMEVTAEESAPRIVEIRIEVRETEIKLNDVVVTMENLPKVFEATYQDGMQVTLIDNYAEYNTFREVKAWIEGTQIKYTEKAR